MKVLLEIRVLVVPVLGGLMLPRSTFSCRPDSFVQRLVSIPIVFNLPRCASKSDQIASRSVSCGTPILVCELPFVYEAVADQTSDRDFPFELLNFDELRRRALRLTIRLSRRRISGAAADALRDLYGALHDARVELDRDRVGEGEEGSDAERGDCRPHRSCESPGGFPFTKLCRDAFARARSELSAYSRV